MNKRGNNFRNRTFLSLVIAAGLVVSGCSSDDDDTDPVVTTEPEADALTASLASIQEKVFSTQCTLCHAGETPAASLSLEDGSSFESLVDVQATNAPNVRVVSGDSANSFLIRKLRGTDLTDTEGSRMPLNGPPYLEDSDIDVIAQWIDDGAANN